MLIQRYNMLVTVMSMLCEAISLLYIVPTQQDQVLFVAFVKLVLENESY